jgi:hypothetical protein
MFLKFKYIKTIVREKTFLLPSEKQPSLGFKCLGCGKDYGTLHVEISENRNSKEQPISRRQKPGIRSERRENLKPIQFSWKKRIVSEAHLAKIRESLAVTYEALNSDSVAESEKQKIMKAYSRFSQHIQEAVKSYELEDLRDREWNVCDENGKLLWNPVKLIKQYREEGDPLYHLNNMPFLFFSKVLKKYPLSPIYSMEKISKMKKGLDLVAKNIESIQRQNWDYSLYEWLIIIAYEETEGIAKTKRMLEALDGSRGKKSRKEIRVQTRKLKDVVDPRSIKDFFDMLDYIDRMAQDDPELRVELEKIKEDKKLDRFNYVERIIKEFGTVKESVSNTKYGDSYNEKIPNELSEVTTILDNGLISFKSEVIRIYHGYNPKYESELRDYKLKLSDLHKQLDAVSYPSENEERRKQVLQEIKRLEESKPKQKDQCGPFHPSKLPFEVIDRLRNQHKLRTFDFF